MAPGFGGTVFFSLKVWNLVDDCLVGLSEQPSDPICSSDCLLSPLSSLESFIKMVLNSWNSLLSGTCSSEVNSSCFDARRFSDANDSLGSDVVDW